MFALLIGTALPFILIERHIRSKAAFCSAIGAIVAAAAMLGIYAMIATALQWDFYRYREIYTLVFGPDLRSGFVRIEATINTHSLGFLSACGIVFVIWLRKRGDYSWPAALSLQAILLATILATDSRSSVLSLAIAIVLYVTFTTERRWLRGTLVLSTLGATSALIAWLLFGPTETIDAHGTVNYRRELLAVSLETIMQYPVFGNFAFLSSGRFEHLRWGAGGGLVDITNLYLLRALELGFIGFALYFYVFIRPVFFGVRDVHGRVSTEAAMLKSLLIAWLFLVVTTSDAGITEFIGLVLAGLIFAQRTILRAPAALNDRVSPDRSANNPVASTS